MIANYVAFVPNKQCQLNGQLNSRSLLETRDFLNKFCKKLDFLFLINYLEGNHMAHFYFPSFPLPALPPHHDIT